MECFFCQDTEPIRGVAPCCYQPVCEYCCGDCIEQCTCGQPLTHYLRRLKKPSAELVQDQVNRYIERKNAYLEDVKTTTGKYTPSRWTRIPRS